MSFATILKKKYLGKEACIFLGDDAETVTYDQSWVANKAYFKGIVESIDGNILTFTIPDNGTIYINCDLIVSVWGPSFDYHKAITTSLTKGGLVGGKRYK